MSSCQRKSTGIVTLGGIEVLFSSFLPPPVIWDSRTLLVRLTGAERGMRNDLRRKDSAYLLGLLHLYETTQVTRFSLNYSAHSSAQWLRGKIAVPSLLKRLTAEGTPSRFVG